MAHDDVDSVSDIISAANAASPGHQYNGDALPSVAPYGGSTGQSVPRNNTAAGDPAVQPVASRQPTMERMGASFRVSAGIFKPVDPSISGSTWANVRVLSPAMVRRGFYDQ